MGGGVKVYGVAASPFVATVLLCLEEAGVEDYELVGVDMAAREQRTQPYLSRNPFGKIPTFVDGELTLFESRAISRYVLRKYGRTSASSPTTAAGEEDLLREPSTLEESAMADVWTEVEAHSYTPAISHIVRECVIKRLIPGGGERDQAVVDENVAKLGEVLDVYEQRLSRSPYLAGDSVGLADLAHFGFTYCLVECTEYGALVESRPGVRAWWGRISARPAAKKVAAMMDLVLNPLKMPSA